MVGLTPGAEPVKRPSPRPQQTMVLRLLLHRLAAKSRVITATLNNLTRLQRFVGLYLFGMLLIWLFIGAVFTSLPAYYTSSWTLILPGKGDGHAVSLDSIGQASANQASPYSNSSLSPSVNYKAISGSATVMQIAADTLGLSSEELTQPKIKLLDQTSVMLFQTTALSPQAAQRQAWALYQAFLSELDRLRDDELARVQEAQLQTLDAFRKKLSAAQQDKLAFQGRAGIISVQQFEQLVTRLEQQRADLDELEMQAAALQQKKQALGEALKLADNQVADAITLRNDALFQGYLERHADIHSQMATVQGTWGKNHPKLRQLEAAHQSVNDNIQQRGQRLIHRHNVTTAELISLGSTKYDNTLLTELIRYQTDLASLLEHISHLKTIIFTLTQRVEKSAPDSAKLEDLHRKQQVATAVFSTAMAKQDIGKVDRFASYPMVQLLTPPDLPLQADFLKPAITLVCGVFASLFFTLMMVLLWLRR